LIVLSITVAGWRCVVSGIITGIALLSGLCTLAFIFDGVRRAFAGSRAPGMRLLIVTTALSIITALFTLWQLALVLQQLGVM
jgi:hypothetical protein